MPELQDILRKCRRLDHRCMIYEIIVFLGYLFVLGLSWVAKKEQLSMLGMLRLLRILLVIMEGLIYLKGWQNRRVLKRLRRYRIQMCTMARLERL